MKSVTSGQGSRAPGVGCLGVLTSALRPSLLLPLTEILEPPLP